MNWNVLRLLFEHELKMLVRARRTVVMAIVLPAVLMPLMLYAQKYSADRRQRLLTGTTYRYAITGESASHIRNLIERTHQSLGDQEDEELDRIRQFKFLELTVSDPHASIDNGEIQFYIETIAGSAADKLPRKEESVKGGGLRRLEGVPVTRVVYRGDRIDSDAGHSRMMALLRLARQRDSQALLVDSGFRGDPGKLFTILDSNIASNGQVTGSIVGRFLTLFLAMMMFTGGAVAAMDIIAGEKERGTLETLLTTAAGRQEIVSAK